MSVSLPSTRQREAKAISDFFSLLGLHPDSIDSLTDISRLRRRDRGSGVRLGSGRSYFLIDGRMSELVQPGKIRLWREVMLLEDITITLPALNDDWRREKRSPSVWECLSSCLLVEIPSMKLHSMTGSDPGIALMLAAMATKRHTLTERLYTASRATPTARVAAVLDYLTEPRRRNRVKTRADGVLVMTTIEELIATGPSQADIADALCLGRATVEKALSELRLRKALRAFEPGERTNRSYPVADRDLLREIARTG
jgi:CRP-like cAMP-binding protein